MTHEEWIKMSPFLVCLPVFIVSLQPLESKIQPCPLDELCAMS